MKKFAIATVISFLLLGQDAAFATSLATGSKGQKISIKSSAVKAGQEVVVTGRGFDETIGIYLAYCVLPKKGAAPTPCGGGVNSSGISDVSHWISSNAPSYATGLATPFTAGGRFTESVTVSRKIGKFDCTKVSCAIAVRSDHLHQGDRSHDLFIPITVRK